MNASARWPAGPLILLLAGTVGVLLSLYAYFVPLTGVTGTPGALLVTGSSLALVVDALILWRNPSGLVFRLFWILGVLGALGTIAAACFLHTWWLVAASIVALAGLLLTLMPRNTAEGATA